MRNCPRCAVALVVHARHFAEIDTCPRCHGAFFDAGEGVAVHGGHAELQFLVADGKAVRRGPSELRCPAHSAGDGGADGEAPLMSVYVIGRGEDAIEVDHCGTCGGFFFDHGEGEALVEVADRAELKTGSGASFAAPPRATHDDVVDAARNRGTLSEMARGVLGMFVQHERNRRIIARTGGPTGPFSPYDDD